MVRRLKFFGADLFNLRPNTGREMILESLDERMLGRDDDCISSVDRIDPRREDPNRWESRDLRFRCVFQSAIRIPQSEIDISSLRPPDPIALTFDDRRCPAGFDGIESVYQFIRVGGCLQEPLFEVLFRYRVPATPA